MGLEDSAVSTLDERDRSAVTFSAEVTQVTQVEVSNEGAERKARNAVPCPLACVTYVTRVTGVT